VAGARIRAVYRAMVRDGGRIGEDSPPEALHDLRKRGKELRYLLELFGAPFPRKVVKPMVSTLKELQDVLGRFQDRAVQAGTLRGLADDLAAEPGGPTALLALGPALDAVLADQRAARQRFAAAFAPFAAAGQRRAVRAAFP
jgi:CHAD domain-containing protein